MSPVSNLYPASPLNVPASITEPSADFKKEVKKVMGSILLFFLVYIILILLSIALAIACMYIGFMVMKLGGHILVIIAGVGIISIGIMVFIFLIKFIFSVKKFDESGTIEIHEETEPHLFNFIKQLTTDTQTSFPGKIILSPEVNACVFYNDSFWSMIFPVRKNLQIGLALVNSLTLSEFKAVMAHEFGHFSQRSMKLGSFVYNVNKVIYNMLFENKSFAHFLQRWGNLHWAIGIFVSVTVEIIKLIQKILQSMYGLINKNYMSLSRQMEFHADAVAAACSGSNNLITALRKTELTGACYNIALDKANELLKNNTTFSNIYNGHSVLMKQYAEDYKLQVENDTPVPDDAFFKKFTASKVNFADQWASHPSREEREDHLLTLNVGAPKDTQPAWVLFTDPQKIQQQMTSVIYKAVPAEKKQTTIDENSFAAQVHSDAVSYILPELYADYFDKRQLSDMDIKAVLATVAANPSTTADLKTFFDDTKLALIESIRADESDTVILQAIADKKIDTKSFDYDGNKYLQENAGEIIAKLKSTIDENAGQLLTNDENIVKYFYSLAIRSGETEASALKKKYEDYFNFRSGLEQFIHSANTIVNLIAALSAGQVRVEQANQIGAGLREEAKKVKPHLSAWIAAGLLDNAAGLKATVEKFIAADYRYIHDFSVFDTDISVIHEIVMTTPQIISKYQFLLFKEVLVYQESLYNNMSAR